MGAAATTINKHADHEKVINSIGPALPKEAPALFQNCHYPVSFADLLTS